MYTHLTIVAVVKTDLCIYTGKAQHCHAHRAKLYRESHGTKLYRSPTSDECTESPAKKFKADLYSQSHLYSEGITTAALYEGASMTALQALVYFFTWFSEHPGISKEALSSMLHMQHHSLLLPANVLPPS